MPLAPGQVSFNGWTGGPGTAYDIVELSGLSMPPVRSSDLPRADASGDFPGRDLLGPRTVSMTVDVLNAPTALTELAFTAQAFALRQSTELDFVYRLRAAGNDRKVIGRPRRCAWSWGVTEDAGGLVRVFIDVECSDPRIFDAVTLGEVLV